MRYAKIFVADIQPGDEFFENPAEDERHMGLNGHRRLGRACTPAYLSEDARQWLVTFTRDGDSGWEQSFTPHEMIWTVQK